MSIPADRRYAGQDLDRRPDLPKLVMRVRFLTPVVTSKALGTALDALERRRAIATTPSTRPSPPPWHSEGSVDLRPACSGRDQYPCGQQLFDVLCMTSRSAGTSARRHDYLGRWPKLRQPVLRQRGLTRSTAHQSTCRPWSSRCPAPHGGTDVRLRCGDAQPPRCR